MPRKTRIIAGVLSGIMGILFGFLRLILHVPTNDLWLAYGSARLLWQGGNPYAYPTNGWPSNPMPTILVIAPFVGFPLEYVGAMLIAVSSALFIFGVFRSGEAFRLWTLASWPFWYNILYAQWGILFLAMLLLPGLVWLAPIKPQLGISVFVSRFQWRQVVYTGLFLVFSWVILPEWFFLWIKQVGGYDGFMPIMYFPIPLLMLLLVWRRNLISHKTIFYLLFCCTPQRLWHDQLLLWYIPDRPWQIIALTACSWLSAITMHNPAFDWTWLVVLALFIPCGMYLLFNGAMARN